MQPTKGTNAFIRWKWRGTQCSSPKGVKINNFQPANNSTETDAQRDAISPIRTSLHPENKSTVCQSNSWCQFSWKLDGEKKQQFHFLSFRRFCFFFSVYLAGKTMENVANFPLFDSMARNCWVATKQGNWRREKLTLMMMSWRLECAFWIHLNRVCFQTHFLGFSNIYTLCYWHKLGENSMGERSV